MYSTEHDDAGEGHVIHTALKVADAKALCEIGHSPIVTVAVGDVDLPAFVSNGVLYIQAPLPLIFEAFVESLPDFVRDLEVRISGPRGTTFSLDSDGSPVCSAPVAKPRVVRDSGVGR